MSYNSAYTLFLIALLFVASNPLANGQITNLGGLTVNGRLCCTPNGNCQAGDQGINGTRVNLNCTILGATVTVGQGITSANGSFNITVRRLTGLILGFPVPLCLAVVQLPLNSTICPILSTTNGVLASFLQSTGSFLTALLGLVQSFTLAGFFHLG